MSDIVQKLWGFCHTLRHDGIDYGDYIEQLTYLLFLKMADERGIDLSRTKFRTEKNREIEVDCSWPTLEEKSGTALTDHYVDVLRALGQQSEAGYNPVFEVRFALQNHPMPEVSLPNLSARLSMRSTGTARFRLGCEITEAGDGLEVAWLFRENVRIKVTLP